MFQIIKISQQKEALLVMVHALIVIEKCTINAPLGLEHTLLAKEEALVSMELALFFFILTNIVGVHTITNAQ